VIRWWLVVVKVTPEGRPLMKLAIPEFAKLLETCSGGDVPPWRPRHIPHQLIFIRVRLIEVR